MEHRIENKHLSDAVKAKIIALKNYTDMTYGEIAKQCDCSVSLFWDIFEYFFFLYRLFH